MNVSLQTEVGKLSGFSSDYNPNDHFDGDYNYSDYYSVNESDELCAFSTNHSLTKALSSYVHPIICVLGFLGNILVIITFAFYKRNKSMTDIYLLNVAISDLLFVLALPFIVYNELHSWPMGPAACKLLRGSYSVNLYSGMLLLAAISTDRYVAIVLARRSFRLRSVFYSRVISLLIWLVSFLVSVPTFYYASWYQPSHSMIFMTDGSLSHRSEHVCEWKFDNSDTAKVVKVAVPSMQLAVGFFLPLGVMMVCYATVIVTLMRTKNLQRHKAVQVVVLVVLVFIVCHLPYNLVLIYDMNQMFDLVDCGHVDSLEAAKAVLQTVAYLRCCLNPVLYAFMGVKFRNHFRRIFLDLWCVGKRYMTPRRFSRGASETFMSTLRRSVDGSSERGTSFTM